MTERNPLILEFVAGDLKDILQTIGFSLLNLKNMSWRLAESLKTLRKQLNAANPARDKVSDGSIGDANHSSRSSDHNPNPAGVVCAIDVTHNQTRGINCHELARSLQSSRDKRIKYLIFNGQITQKTDITKWKPYTGKNAHKQHLHISVASDAKLYDDAKEWNLSAGLGGTENGIYTVKSGDTVSAIIKRHGISMLEFYQLNNFNADNFDPDNIRVGDKFRVS